jgi:hypothetical protein
MNENKANTAPKGVDLAGGRESRELRDARDSRDLKEGGTSPAASAPTPLKGRWERELKREEWSPPKREEAPAATDCASSAPANGPEGNRTAENPAPGPPPAPPAAGGRSPLAEDLHQAAASLTAIALALDALDAILHHAGAELSGWLGKADASGEPGRNSIASGDWTQSPLELREMLRQYLLR